ncbi:hypothetical protein BT93_F1659 [Corymbia citriodora subsp. variegata]|nr:hypothetical protein BT93_F1659 [Corymbia citriodora subsp. variegata]
MAATDESPLPNWLDLPRDIATMILQKLSAMEIFLKVQLVCKNWRSLCREPAMWQSIDMSDVRDLPDGYPIDFYREVLVNKCREAVNCSLGGCVDINVECFGTDELLKYTVDRRLRLVRCENITDEGLSEAATKLPLLEVLELSYCSFSKEALETVGQRCPLLESLKLNRHLSTSFIEDEDYDGEAQAIGKNMHGLRHLQLFGNNMTNEGLEVILDGCPHLEFLDLRECSNVDMEGDLGNRCTEQIKDLRRPDDRTDDYEFHSYHYRELTEFHAVHYYEFSDYDGLDEDQ